MARWVAADGVGIEYEVTGSGPPVLLLHGFAASGIVNWIRPGVADALESAGHTVVVYDARGHGLSDAPHEEAAYAGGAMVQDAIGLVDHLGFDALSAVGYSMGAQVTAAWAARDARVRRAVLGGIGSRLLLPQPGERRYPAQSIALALESAASATLPDATGRAFRAFADATGSDRLALAAIQRARVVSGQADLSELRIPVLVLVGEGDTLIGDASVLARALPDARLQVVPGDHLSAVTSPEFATAAVGFLAGA